MGAGRERSGVADLVGAQPVMQLVAAERADSGGGRELGNEQERAVAGEVQGGLEFGADGDEAGA